MQRLFQVQQLLALIFRKLAHGDPCPRMHDICNILFRDSGLPVIPFAFPIGLCRGNLRAEVLLLIAQRSSTFIVLVVDGLFLFFAQPFDAFAQCLYVRRGVISAQANAACSFIHKVNRFIRQEPVRNIAAGKLHRRADGFIRNARFMVRFIAVTQAEEDGNGLLPRWLADGYRLETPLKRSILFDVLAVFVKRCCANHLDFPAGERRL